MHTGSGRLKAQSKQAPESRSRASRDPDEGLYKARSREGTGLMGLVVIGNKLDKYPEKDLEDLLTRIGAEYDDVEGDTPTEHICALLLEVECTYPVGSRYTQNSDRTLVRICDDRYEVVRDHILLYTSMGADDSVEVFCLEDTVTVVFPEVGDQAQLFTRATLDVSSEEPKSWEDE